MPREKTKTGSITKATFNPRPRLAVRADVRHFRPPVTVVYKAPATAETPKLFALHTLSESGGGFYPGKAPLQAQFGKAREAFLVVGNTRIPIDARIVYLANQDAGVQFLDLNDHWKSAIRHLFRIEFAAAALRPDFARDGAAFDDEENGLSTARHRLIYQGDARHHVEVILDPKLEPESFACRFPELGGDIFWTRGQPIKIQWDFDTNAPASALATPQLRSQLISLIHNLAGLGSGTRRALTLAISRAEIA